MSKQKPEPVLIEDSRAGWLEGFEPTDFDPTLYDGSLASLLIESPARGAVAEVQEQAPSLALIAPTAANAANVDLYGANAVVGEEISEPVSDEGIEDEQALLEIADEVVYIEDAMDVVVDEAFIESLMDGADNRPPITSWPRIDFDAIKPSANLDARVTQNLAAIRQIQALRSQGSIGTAVLDEAVAHELLQFSAFGGAARLFETDSAKNSLAARRPELKGLLSKEEYDGLRQGLLTAYYTDHQIASAIWSLIRAMGFKGGRVLEPSAGTGVFLATMPEDLAKSSAVTAVELESISADILKSVYAPHGVSVHHGPIETAPIPAGFFDLVVGNVPFGDYPSLDPRKHAFCSWSIHNYFIGRSLEAVRPGGIVVLLTSSYTMGSKSASHREWINANAELLGAFRLPGLAFGQSAQADVVTDLMILRKREAPTYSVPHGWKATIAVPESYWASTVGCDRWDLPMVNEYFVANPNRVIGQPVIGSRAFGKVYELAFNGSVADVAERLESFGQTLANDAYVPASRASAGVSAFMAGMETVRALHSAMPGSFVLKGNLICLAESETTWLDVDEAYKGKTRERIIGMMAIRDLARSMISQQVVTADDSALAPARIDLNRLYDAFVKNHGPISTRANVSAFSGDPDLPLLLSLERYDETEEVYRKADIFSKRTAGPVVLPETVETVKDAVLVSLAASGKVDMRDMVRRLRMKQSEVEAQLTEQSIAFLDPEDGEWKPADEYLSGNIRHKIAAATSAGKGFESNITALEKVIPADLGPRDVEARLGATWIPASVIREFSEGIVGIRYDANLPPDEWPLTVSYDAASASWSMKPRYGNLQWVGDRTLNSTTWGTDKRCALELIQCALNQSQPKVTYKDPEGKTKVDREATMKAREKFGAIREEFKRWVFKDDARRDSLLRIYNDQFNQTVTRRFDGSHLRLFGMSSVVTPYSHQLDAIWRIVTAGNTLLAHVVGAGKTLTMIASAVELKRLGKTRKSLVVVPNHLLNQFCSDAVRFFPTARVLMATKKDLEKERRRAFALKCATGDWDVVVMTASSFESIPVSVSYKDAFIRKTIENLDAAIEAAKQGGARESVRAAEMRKKKMEAKLSTAEDRAAKDDFITFEELGCDWLFYDEAHALKNLLRISKMPSVSGLSNAASQRAFDAWMKVNWIMEQRGGKQEGVVFATATPIANSIAELHVMQRFLQPNTLARMGILEFDAWASNFAESVQAMEINPTGSGYRLRTRFSRFTNLPELMGIFREVADIKTRREVQLKVPAIAGGKPTVITSKSSPAQKAYTESLVERAEKIRSGQVDPKDDNMLLVTGCGRKAALDIRLVEPNAPIDPQSKVFKVAEQIHRIWDETRDQRGTQLVFSDLGTPTSSGFSVYSAIRDELVGKGIPRAEIEFIHDHDTDVAKDKLFQRVRSGDVRVLIGSTEKMGAGTNVQSRLKALHQVDPPWRPADVEQRDGRILRPGNIWEEVEVFRYVTEGSFDAYSWSGLTTKLGFIEQVMLSESGIRSVEDISGGSLSYNEIKAISTGNPMVLEKATIDAEVMRFSLMRDNFEQDRWIAKRRKDSLDLAMGVLQSSIPVAREDARVMAELLNDESIRFEASFWAKGQFNVKPGTSLADQLALALGGFRMTAAGQSCGEHLVGNLGPFELWFERRLDIILRWKSTASGQFYTVDRGGVAVNESTRIGAALVADLKRFDEQATFKAERLKRITAEIETIDAMLGQGFEHEEKLDQLILRQKEIESLLDLDKSEAGTEAIDASESTSD